MSLSELDADRRENLGRIAVIGSQHALVVECRAESRYPVGQDEMTGIRVLAQEVVARSDVAPLRQIAPLDADRPAIVFRRVGKAAIEQRGARLIEAGDTQLELLRIAAV